MRLRARGLLLFSFAFSSVLASSEVVETPSRTTNGKPGLESRTASESQTRLMMPNIGHGMEKRSPGLFPQNFSGEEGQKKESLASLRDDLEKRTRMGFTGMRGKKEYTADDYCAKNLRANIERALTLNKRYSGDFLGSKRASSTAFHGMRGKKSDDYDNEIPDEEALDFEDPLPPPREFLLDSGLFDDPARLLEDEEDMEITKRSPYAFQGMRGKKENVYDLKRAMGFLGMRGKKATEVWNDVNYKRVPQTSFFGLKGKKAQSSGFFGMRGKKSSPSAFFGIKGKQEPEMDNLEDFRFLSQFKEPESRSRFRRGISWLSNSKKAKNAFFGVRGKKSTRESLGSSFSSSYE